MGRNRKSQIDLFPKKWFEGLRWSDQIVRGKRKAKRPLSTRKDIHLILKSSRSLFLRKHGRVHELIRRYANQHFVKIKDQVVHTNHIHLRIRLVKIFCYRKFVCALTGQLALLFGGKGFFLSRPFTRILTSAREVFILIQYFEKNWEQVNDLCREPIYKLG